MLRRVLFLDKYTCLLRKGHLALRKRAADSGNSRSSLRGTVALGCVTDRLG
jgi:hypothetical protein